MVTQICTRYVYTLANGNKYTVERTDEPDVWTIEDQHGDNQRKPSGSEEFTLAEAQKFLGDLECAPKAFFEKSPHSFLGGNHDRLTFVSDSHNATSPKNCRIEQSCTDRSGHMYLDIQDAYLKRNNVRKLVGKMQEWLAQSTLNP